MRLTLLLLLSLLTACGGSSAPEPATVEGGEVGDTQGGETPEDAPQATPPALELSMLEAGAEPRRELRFRIPDGTTARFRMTQEVETAITLGGHAMGSPMSFPIVTEMSMGPTRTTTDGMTHVPFQVESVELGRGVGLTQEAQEAALAAVAPLRGARGYTDMTPRGEVTGSNVDVPPNAAPQVADMLENMRKAMVDAAAPFPVEAVGVGARWQIHKRVERRGLMVETMSTYTLTAMTADGGHFDVVVSGSAPPQPFPTSNDGSQAELQSMSIRGAGQTDFQFNSIASTSRSEVELDMQALIRSGDQSQGMTMHVRQTLVLEPR